MAKGAEAVLRAMREAQYGGNRTRDLPPRNVTLPGNVAPVALPCARCAGMEAEVTLLRAELAALRGKGAERVAAYRARRKEAK